MGPKNGVSKVERLRVGIDELADLEQILRFERGHCLRRTRQNSSNATQFTR